MSYFQNSSYLKYFFVRKHFQNCVNNVGTFVRFPWQVNQFIISKPNSRKSAKYRDERDRK